MDTGWRCVKIWFARNTASVIFLAVLVFISYLNSLGNDFVSDDKGLLINVPIWNFQYLRTIPHAFLRPLIYLIAYKLGGFNTLLFHLSNVLFHLGTVVLSYAVLSLLTHKRTALIASAIFAVHPILVESITWISGGGYVQYSFFFLLSLLLYICSKKNGVLYLYSLIFYIFMLMSSEKAVSMCLAFFFYEISFGNVSRNRKKMIPYFSISSLWVLFYLRLFVLRAGYFLGQQAIDPTPNNPLLQIPVAISSYLQLLFLPDGLTLYHSEMIFTPLEFSLRVLVTIIFGGLIVWNFKKNRYVFFWLSFFVITLLPTINPFVHAWVVAERYVYLGTLGILAVLTWIIDRLFQQRFTKGIYVSCLAIIIMALSVRTIVRNRDWKNEDTLWLATARTSPSSPQNHNNLGDYYWRHHDYQNSIKEFKRAIELKPNYADAFHNLGNTYRDSGDQEHALESYKKALSINPGLWQSYQNISAIYFAQKKYPESIEYLKQGLISNPNNLNLLFNLGKIYAIIGDKDKAGGVFSAILSLEPNNQNAKQGMALLQQDTIKQ